MANNTLFVVLSGTDCVSGAMVWEQACAIARNAYKGRVRRATAAEIARTQLAARKTAAEAWDEIGTIEDILSSTKRGCPTGGVWKDSVSHKATRYAGTI